MGWGIGRRRAAVLGVDLDPAGVRVARLGRRQGRWQLEQAAVEMAGASPPRGEAPDVDALAGALRRALAMTGQPPGAEAVTAVDADEVLVSEVHLPAGLDGIGLEARMVLEAARLAGLPPAALYLDHAPLPEAECAAGERAWRLVVTRREAVAWRAGVLQRAGLRLRAVDVRFLALQRTWRLAGGPGTGTIPCGQAVTALLEWGPDRQRLCVFVDGQVRHWEVQPAGGALDWPAGLPVPTRWLLGGEAGQVADLPFPGPLPEAGVGVPAGLDGLLAADDPLAGLAPALWGAVGLAAWREAPEWTA